MPRVLQATQQSQTLLLKAFDRFRCDLLAQRALVFAALELLVSNRVTGLPVLDDAGAVVGVVSDYDLLSLEGIAESAAVLSFCRPCNLCPASNIFGLLSGITSIRAKRIIAAILTLDWHTCYGVFLRPHTTVERLPFNLGWRYTGYDVTCYHVRCSFW